MDFDCTSGFCCQGISGRGAQEIYICGYLRDGGNIMKTLDGGVTWSNVSVPGPYQVDSIWLEGSSTVYAHSDLGLHRSLDGGATWADLGGGVPVNYQNSAYDQIWGDGAGTVFVASPLGVLQVYPSWDTDGDGLVDQAETGTGVYRGYWDTGTDPFSKDTDGDGIEDLAESAAGTALDAAAAPGYSLTEISPAFEYIDQGITEMECDDCTLVYNLPWPFPFFGMTFQTITVDDNGNVWFINPGFSQYGFDLTQNIDMGPVIAALNTDLTSFEGGRFTVERLSEPDRVVIEWFEVESKAGWRDGDDNSFQVVLFPDGRIRLNYGEDLEGPSLTDVGSGVSAGTGGTFVSLTSVLGPVYGTGRNRSFEFTPSVVAPVADTDGDDLPDVFETNTGVYLSPSDAGTDPSDPDTDGDSPVPGLPDNVL